MLHIVPSALSITILLFMLIGFVTSFAFIFLLFTNTGVELDASDYLPYEQVDLRVLPVTLEDMGIEPFPYRCVNMSSDQYNIIGNHNVYTDSLADDADSSAQVMTLHYEKWYHPLSFVLDKKENQLKEQAQQITEAAADDYQALRAYWLDDDLLLRYDGVLVRFDGNKTTSAVVPDACAAAFGG